MADGPVYMLNALWFKPDGGAAKYGDYMRAVAPLIANAGAELVTPTFAPVETLQGDFQPDLVFVVRYPNEAAFRGMITSEEYQAIAHLRTEALAQGVLTRCEVREE